MPIMPKIVDSLDIISKHGDIFLGIEIENSKIRFWFPENFRDLCLINDRIDHKSICIIRILKDTKVERPYYYIVNKVDCLIISSWKFHDIIHNYNDIIKQIEYGKIIQDSLKNIRVNEIITHYTSSIGYTYTSAENYLVNNFNTIIDFIDFEFVFAECWKIGKNICHENNCELENVCHFIKYTKDWIKERIINLDVRNRFCKKMDNLLELKKAKYISGVATSTCDNLLSDRLDIVSNNTEIDNILMNETFIKECKLRQFRQLRKFCEIIKHEFETKLICSIEISTSVSNYILTKLIEIFENEKYKKIYKFEILDKENILKIQFK